MLSVRRGLCTQRQRSSQLEGDGAETDATATAPAAVPGKWGEESTKARKIKGEKESKKYRVRAGRNGTEPGAGRGVGGWRGGCSPGSTPGTGDLPRPGRPWETAFWASFLPQSRGFDLQDPNGLRRTPPAIARPYDPQTNKDISPCNSPSRLL